MCELGVLVVDIILLFSIILALILAFLIIISITLLRFRRLVKACIALLRAREERNEISKKLRRRYVVFTAICEERVGFSDLQEAVSSKFCELFSKTMYYKAAPQLVLFDESTQRGVYRVTHLYLDHLIVALGLVKNIKGKKCILLPLRTTGTLKKARELTRKLRF
jgi:ribonuclease P/MRP protein subunit POP5